MMILILPDLEEIKHVPDGHQLRNYLAPMINRILNYNKKIYLRYNQFRKQIFTELAQKESEAVCYLLPWLLSINHFACPGYIPDLKKPFRVFNIDNEPEIIKREPVFKRMFGVTRQESMLKPPKKYLWIEGLYTIGSVGTLTQTSESDCDVWVCYDKSQFTKTALKHLHQKLNLIKDWMDINLKMPVYFFISDITDIRENHFGSVDTESSGSTQKNVLKEEFYRTCMLICGKIPLWWLCYNDKVYMDYEQAVSAIKIKAYDGYDIVDFGNLECIESHEYFGATLWQLHKSLTRPLKSIVKMILLKMLLDAPQEKLVCHEFRKEVLSVHNDTFFPDSQAFTILSIFRYYERHRKATLEFLKQCIYLRCKIKANDKSQTLKKKIADDLFTAYPIADDIKQNLSEFASWDLGAQIDLGKRIFKLLIQIYKEISSAHTGEVGIVDQQDLTIIGRKLSMVYQRKKDKIPIIHKPTDTLNLSSARMRLVGNMWQLFIGGQDSKPIVANSDIIYDIAFMVWNNLFVPGVVYMEPNPSSVTLQEIINLGKRMRDFLGTYDTVDIEYSEFLKKEHITKILVIVSFEKSPIDKDINDFGIVYLTNWGELFVKRFDSPFKLDIFLNLNGVDRNKIMTSYYVQRNVFSYEKIIQRTKNIILDSFNNLSTSPYTGMTSAPDDFEDVSIPTINRPWGAKKE